MVKIKETSAAKKATNPAVQTDEQMSNMIDSYCEIVEQIKDLEAKKVELYGAIKDHGLLVWAQKFCKGIIENFKLQGKAAQVLFMVQKRAKALGQAEHDAFSEAFGKKAACDCLEVDYASVRLNPQAFADAKNRKKIEAAIAKLEAELGIEILQAGNYKITSDCFENLQKHAKTTDNVIQAVKILGFTTSLTAK